jgi:hypothetical protein
MPQDNARGTQAVFVWYAAVLDRSQPYTTMFGFFLQTEGNLSRVNDLWYDARERKWYEVVRCYACMRSHMVRPWLDVRALAISRDPMACTEL